MEMTDSHRPITRSMAQNMDSADAEMIDQTLDGDRIRQAYRASISSPVGDFGASAQTSHMGPSQVIASSIASELSAGRPISSTPGTDHHESPFRVPVGSSHSLNPSTGWLDAPHGDKHMPPADISRWQAGDADRHDVRHGGPRQGSLFRMSSSRPTDHLSPEQDRDEYLAQLRSRQQVAEYYPRDDQTVSVTRSSQSTSVYQSGDIDSYRPIGSAPRPANTGSFSSTTTYVRQTPITSSVSWGGDTNHEHRSQGPRQFDSAFSRSANTTHRPQSDIPNYDMYYPPGYPDPAAGLLTPQSSAPKFSLPTYKGKGSWRSFWMQFDMVTRQFRWDDNTMLNRLIGCLQDQALEYVAQLPGYMQTSLHRLLSALEHRFGDHVLPETYRATLQSLKKQPKEGLEEYAARTRNLMAKAYPGLEGTDLFQSLSVETLVGGLSDPNLVYDVLTKKPKSVEEAIDLIKWHECCKGNLRRRTSIRQVMAGADLQEEPWDEVQDDHEIRWVNGKRFVTEERLNQFGRELKESLISSISKLVLEQLKPEKKSKQPTQDKNQQRQGMQTSKWKDSAECFYCHEIGHVIKECPRRAKQSSDSEGSAVAAADQEN